MRRAVFALTSLTLAGCGSSWIQREGSDPLFIGCIDLANFYRDVDEDTWGDGSQNFEALCEANAAENLTASNGRDCADDDAKVTARIGGACPADLVSDPDGVAYRGHDFLGSEFQEQLGSEYVIVHAPTDVVRFTEAETACEAWGGVAVSATDSTELVDQGKLATFATASELAQLQAEVKDIVSSQTHKVWAGFIGMSWTGSVTAGTWSWVDGGTATLSEVNLTWCTDDLQPLEPLDFFPHLNGSAHDGDLSAVLPSLRPALVLTENNRWCVGLPRHAVPASVRAEIPEEVWEGIGSTPVGADSDVADSDYERPEWRDWEAVDAAVYHSPTAAHFVCERPKPDADDYQEFVTAGSEDEAPSE